MGWEGSIIMGEGLDSVEPRRDRERTKSQESRLEKGHAWHQPINLFNLHTLALSLSRIHSVQTWDRPVPECQFPERGGSLEEVRTCIKVQKMPTFMDAGVLDPNR